MLNSSSRFAEISWRSFLRNIEHSLPIPPVAENTTGAKVPCSTFKIRKSDSLFFALVTLGIGIKYPNFGECFLSSTTNPLGLMLDLALPDWFPWIYSPNNGCKSSSTLTLFVTSSTMPAMLPLNSCLKLKIPALHDIAPCMLSGFKLLQLPRSLSNVVHISKEQHPRTLILID